MKNDNIYQFNIELNNGSVFPLSELKGKVILIVNTAIHSPFVDFYPFLQNLYRRFHSDGFEIIDIPTNQFQEQTPETDAEIDDYCRNEFQTTFLRCKKQIVSGAGKSELFAYLIRKKKFMGFDSENLLTPVLNCREIKKGPDWMSNPEIRENFTFFFVSRSGKVVKRFEATAQKEKIEACLVRLLNEIVS